MKESIHVAENKIRKIGSKTFNTFLKNGIEQHRPTELAPLSFMDTFTPELTKKLESRHKQIEKLLLKTLGEPFFKDTGIFIYQGDSTELLERLRKTDFKSDLTITSPPYNIGKEYEQPMPVDNYVKWCTAWIDQVYNITKETGAFWLNVGYLEVPQKGLCVPIPYLLWDKSEFYFLQEVVWKYGAGVSTKFRLSPRNEKWIFYVKNPQRYTFNLDDIRDPNVKYPNQQKNGKYRCNSLGKNPSDVWEFPKVTTGTSRSSKERTGHPAQFPLAVVERIIKACSNEAEIILDPFAGSVSAGVAAYGLGRIFLGFELKKEYCEIAVNRLLAFKKEKLLKDAQCNLF